MANRANFGWDGLKKTVSRTKFQVLAKVGKADQTTDAQFNFEKERFEDRFKLIKKLESAIGKYNKTLIELSKAHIEFTESIHQLYEGHCKHYQATVVNQKITTGLDSIRIGFEETLRDHVQVGIHQYTGQWRSLEKRIEERQRRRLDMDRYMAEVISLEKKGPDHPKLPQAREKAEAMNLAFNELNEELMHDLRKLLEDRFDFMDSVFATITDGQVNYYMKSAEAFRDLEPLIRDIDRNAYQHRPMAITPDDVSVYRKPFSQYLEEVVASNLASSPYVPSSPSPSPTFVRSGSTSPRPVGGPPVGVPPGATSPSSSSQNVVRARALYAFVPQEAGELGFNPGDILIITNKSGEWWDAELNGRRGSIPCNYVQIL